MTVVSVLAFRFKSGSVEEALAGLRISLKDTRAFEGCISVDVVQDVDDPAHVHLVERWESLANDKAYRAWRATPDGASPLTAIMSLLDGAPTVTVSELREDI